MSEQRIPWAFMRNLADQVVAELTPYCERIEVAGSVRRRRETVKDIEVLVIPRRGEQPLDMFGNQAGVAPDHLAEYLLTSRLWTKRPNTGGGTTFGTLNKLMLRRAGPPCPEWVPVDIFTGSAENWGRDLWIRTGPADWNVLTAARALRMGGHMHAYGPSAFTRGSEKITCPDEASFAAWLGVPLLAPELRADEKAWEMMT